MPCLFRCRHEQPDAIISWLINGTSSNQYSDVIDGSISESDGTFVYTLTIPAIPVYNGTEVVCLATFIDGSPSETTPPVMLILFIGLLIYYTMIKLRLLALEQIDYKPPNNQNVLKRFVVHRK